MRMSSRGNVPSFSLTPIWPGYPQLGCYQYHQPIVVGSLWWRLWSIAINYGHLNIYSDKNFLKPIKYAHINISHKKGYWFKIRMEFFWPLLAKVELICQQLAMPQLSGVEGVASQPLGCRIGWLGAHGVVWLCEHEWRQITSSTHNLVFCDVGSKTDLFLPWNGTWIGDSCQHALMFHYGNQSRGYFNGGRPLWPPAVHRLAARPSQSNPRGSGPEVLKRERGHVTAETWSFGGGGLQGHPAQCYVHIPASVRWWYAAKHTF